MNRSTRVARPIALFASLLALAAAGCGRPFYPATPPGFVDLGDRYSSSEHRATNADGVVLGVRAFDNEPKGELAFWARTIERRMREMGGYALIERRNVQNRGGLAGVELRFGHDEGNVPHVYHLAIFVTDARVFLVEAGGPKAEMVRLASQIDWSIRSFLHK